jgi:hypothetical protein
LSLWTRGQIPPYSVGTSGRSYAGYAVLSERTMIRAFWAEDPEWDDLL